MVSKYNMPLLEPSYYLQAIDIYQQRFKHAVFLFYSDDMGWVQRNVMSKILSKGQPPPVYMMGSGNLHSRYNDTV